jgi:hypothetical protein
MHGWYAQLSTEVTPRFGLVAQVDGSYGPDEPGEEPDYRDHAFLGGARFTYALTPRVAVFWQGLAGVLHSVAEAYSTAYERLDGTVVEIRNDELTINYLALQPGGGATFMFTPRVGIRGHFDLQFAIPDQGAWEGISIFPRVAVGGVFRLGGGP